MLYALGVGYAWLFVFGKIEHKEDGILVVGDKSVRQLMTEHIVHDLPWFEF
jgi:hypothetical protein